MRAANALVLLLLLAVTVAGSAATLDPALSASATTRFDGSWTATLITQSGECERSGQATGQIVNGTLVAPGAGVGVTVSGHVNADGEVSGRITTGPYYVTGSGRLSGNSGSGTWQGLGPNGRCSGIWNAKRI
jgi:hypothetical protein